MRHMCEPLSLDELEETFDSQAMNVGIINIIEIRDELSPGCDDGLLKHCDLLIFRECDTGLVPAIRGTPLYIRAYRTMS